MACGVCDEVIGVEGAGEGGIATLGFGVDAVGGLLDWGVGVTVGAGGGIDRGEGVCDVFGAARKGLAPEGRPNMGIGPPRGGETPAGGARMGAARTPELLGLISGGGGGIGGGAIGVGAEAGPETGPGAGA